MLPPTTLVTARAGDLPQLFVGHFLLILQLLIAEANMEAALIILFT